MINSADPDQLASSEASWSGATLFVKVGYIRVQQDKSLWTGAQHFLQDCIYAQRRLRSAFTASAQSDQSSLVAHAIY